MNDSMSLVMIGLPLVCVLWALAMLLVLKPTIKSAAPRYDVTPEQLYRRLAVEQHPPDESQTQVNIHEPTPGEDPNERPVYRPR